MSNINLGELTVQTPVLGDIADYTFLLIDESLSNDARYIRHSATGYRSIWQADIAQTVANLSFATTAQGAKADTALQPASNLDATKLVGLVPDNSIPSSIARDFEISAAIASLGLGSAAQASTSSFAAAIHTHNSSSISDFSSAVDARLIEKQDQNDVLDSLIGSYGTGEVSQVPRKTSTGWEFYTPSAGGTGGISLTDLSATSPVQYNPSTGNFSFNSSSFLQTSAIGTTVQGFDADLSGLAGLSTTGAVERTGAGTFSTFTVSTAGKALIDDTDASAQRTTLGLGTAATAAATSFATAAQGTKADTALQPESNLDATKLVGTVPDGSISSTIARDSEVASAISALSAVYQPLDSDLTAIAALSTTAYGRGFLDLTDAAAARTKLALGSASTSASTDFATAAQGTKADTALQPAAIGTTVQAYDSDLASIAALTTTSFGRALLELANASSGRTAFGSQQDLSTIMAPQSFNDQPISRISIVPVVEPNTTRTLTNADNGAWIVFTNSSAITLTIPNGLVTGFNCTIIQGNTGQITWTGSNFLLDPDQTGHIKTKGQNSRVSFVYRSLNTYDVIGSTTDV